MADVVIDTSKTSAIGADLISAYVQQVLSETAVLIGSIDDRTSELEPGAKSLSIGRRTALSAESKAEGTAYEAQAFEWAADKLDLSKQEGVYTQLTRKAAAQATQGQDLQILQASAQALVDKLEAQVYAELVKVSASAPDHIVTFGVASTIALADILNARKLLRVQNVPMNDVFLAINPAQEAQLLAMEQFIDASRYGSNEVLQNGEIGRIYGFRVLVTNAVTANTAIAYHKSHVAFARQIEVTWEQSRILKNSMSEFLLETLYGLKVLDSGKRGVLMNNTGA
jgi:hypothetical protein